MKKLVMFLIVMMSTSAVFAQSLDGRQATSILEKQAFLAAMNGNARNSAAAPDMVKLLSLLNDVNSSIYVYGGTTRVYGDSPECVYTDVASFGALQNSGINASNVKMITIKISSSAQLNSALNLATLSNYPNLKYVYIISEVDATSTQIERIVRNIGSGYSVFYSVQKAS